MSEYKPNAAKSRILSDAAKQRQLKHHQKSLALLNAYHAGDPEAVKEFREHCIGGNEPDFEATLLKARMLVSGGTTVVHRLSLEKLKKEAKDLFKQFKVSAPEAIGRFKEFKGVRVQRGQSSKGSSSKGSEFKGVRLDRLTIDLYFQSRPDDYDMPYPFSHSLSFSTVKTIESDPVEKPVPAKLRILVLPVV